MNIVHVVPQLVKGGAERVMVDLANHAAGAGHQVAVVAAKKADESLLRAELRPEIDVRYVFDRADSRFRPYLRLLPWLLRNRKWLFAQDIVHCHLTFGSLFGALTQLIRKLSRRRGPAVVESYQAVAAPIPRWLRWIHARLAARRDAFAIMADDGYWGDFLKARPKLPSKIIPNGIAVPDWPAVGDEEKARYRREIGLPQSCRFVVLTVGRVVDERRPWVFLPIFRRVADAIGPDVHFVYGGGGPASGRLLAMAAEQGLAGRVHVTGLVRNPSLPLSITDVYVTLNVGPVTGIASLEAVFSRLPVVAVQIFPGYDRGRSDWIKSDTDEAELAADVVTLLQSPDERRQVAERQYGYAWDHLRVEVMAGAYDDLYRQAIERLSAR
jgi:glycosyltransferase involved in cell wall biosynthesis